MTHYGNDSVEVSEEYLWALETLHDAATGGDVSDNDYHEARQIVDDKYNRVLPE